MNELIVWSPGMTLRQIEKEVILKAFRFYRGNKSTTAIALGISIRTLDTRLEEYSLETKKDIERSDAERKQREEFLARQRGVVTREPLKGYDVLSTTTGVRVESAQNAPAESEMPVPKRPQVQAMLPGQAAASGARKNR